MKTAQVVILSVGVILSLGWVADTVVNLHHMYRSGRNGVLLRLAWTALVVALCHLGLQIMWFLSALTLYRLHPTGDEAQRLLRLLEVRGLIGSILITAIVIMIALSWRRVRQLDALGQLESDIHRAQHALQIEKES